MARIHQHLRLRTGVTRRDAKPCPSRRYRCDRRPARTACTPPAAAGSARGACATRSQRLFKPANAFANALRARIIRSIRHPQRDVARSQRLADLNAIEYVLESALANVRIGIAQRSKLVFLVLKEVGINRARAHAVVALQFAHRAHIRQPVGQIPQHMQRQRRRHAGEPVHFGCIGKLLFDGGAAAACTNLPKRVPVLAKPHEGISI